MANPSALRPDPILSGPLNLTPANGSTQGLSGADQASIKGETSATLAPDPRASTGYAAASTAQNRVDSAAQPCWFRQFSDKPCDHYRMRAHLIQKQRLRNDGNADLAEDPRTWREGCGVHHHRFDHGQLFADQPAANVLPLEDYPEDFRELMAQHGYSYRGHRGWRFDHSLEPDSPREENR